jgi:IclR family pca regulon transcriptional regulator
MASRTKAEDPGRRFVGSLDKAFQVLEAFSSGTGPLGLTELSRLSGVERSATQRILFTLKKIGYVRQDPRTKLYNLSPRMLRFSNTFLQTNRIQAIAAPILKGVNEQCEETVNLTELDGTDVVYVLRFPSRHVVSVNLSQGSLLPAYCTAPGRAILAHLEPSEVEDILARSALEKRTPFTRTKPAEIRQILEEVRRDGFCLNNQEAFLGDISISSPVFDEAGQVAAAVNIAVPYPRWSVQRAQGELMPLVVDCAQQISSVMRSNAAGARAMY